MVDAFPMGPHWDGEARLARLEAARLRTLLQRDGLNPLPQITNDHLRAATVARIEGAKDFFTGIGYGITDAAMGRIIDGSEMRKLALSREEWESKIKQYAEALKSGQVTWQEGSKDIINRMRKLADDAGKLYEAFAEYPAFNNYKDSKEDDKNAAIQHDFSMSLVNQAIAFPCLKTLEDLDELKITDKPEFKQMEHFLDTFKEKENEREALARAAEECKIQAGLAESQVAHSQKQNREGGNCSRYIQSLSANIGGVNMEPRRLLAEGKVKEYHEQAEQRVIELETILAHVERRREEIEGKIDEYTSQARKRANAAIEAAARQGALTAQIGVAGVRRNDATTRVVDAGGRTTTAAARAAATPIGNRSYKNLADTIIAQAATGLAPAPAAIATATALAIAVTPAPAATIAAAGAAIVAVINPVAAATLSIATITPILQNISRNDETRAIRAETRARAAKTRAADAETRARAAKTRAIIAKTYNDPTISDEAAKEVVKHAKMIEKREKEVVEITRLIKSNEKIIQESHSVIRTNFLAIRDILTTAGGAALDADRMSRIQTCANEIEKAEIAKNRALVLVEQAAREEQAVLTRIRDELPREVNALAQEVNTATAISNLANGVAAAPAGVAPTTDMAHLQTLLTDQSALETILKGTPAVGVAGVLGARAPVPGLVELERMHCQAVKDVEEAIHNRNNNIGGVGGLKAAELVARNAVTNPAGVNTVLFFQAALANVRNSERTAAEVLKRNAIHRASEGTVDAKQAVEYLQKLKDNFVDQDDKKLKNRSDGHIFIDPLTNAKGGIGKATINGVWFPIRNIERFTPRRDPVTGEWETVIGIRSDLTMIKVSRETRDAGKVDFDPIETKRLLNGGIENSKYSLTLRIDGDTYANGGRQLGILTYIDKEAKTLYEQAMGEYRRVSRAPLPAGMTRLQAANVAADAMVPNWRRYRNHTDEKRFDMQATESIHLMVDLVNEKVTAPCLSFKTVEQALPNPVINHAAALALRQGEGWSDEEKRRMWRFDLGTTDEQGNPMPVLRLPNGDEYRMSKFDFTETKCDKINGLTLQYKGPKRGMYQLNLPAASSDIFNELSNSRKALKEMERQHIEKGVELLKQALLSGDPTKIDATLGSIKIHDGIKATQSSLTKKELEEVPRDRIQLRKLREKIRARKDAQTPKWVEDGMKSTAKMLGAEQQYMYEVKKHILAIHKNNPLSALRVEQSRANSEKVEYQLIKHSSSRKKQKLRDDIRAAEHLDKTVLIGLLVDPKQGPASTVKKRHVNGLDLFREYKLYKNKQDFANQIERQHVEQYVANIAMVLQTNLNIGPYYANQWNLEKAMEAARDGHFLSKDVNGTRIIGASEYIRNLKQVDLPSSSDQSLASKRQADEYEWVTYLRHALARAEGEDMPELLEEALSVAQQIQVSRSNNLELAQRALDLDTPSEEADKILKKMQIEISLPWSESESEKAEKAEKARVDLKDKTLFDPKAIAKKSPEELAKDASKVAEKIYADAIAAIERRLDSIADPGLQQKFREKAVELVMDQAKQAFEINKQDKAIQNQWQKYEELIKEMNRQRWKDLWKDLALLWLKNSVESGSKIANNLLSELEKIAMAFAKA